MSSGSSPGRQATSKPLPRLSSGTGKSDRFGDLPGMGHRHAVNFGKGLGIEALRTRKHVQAAPVDAGFEEAEHQRGYAIRIDTEWAGPADRSSRGPRRS